VTCLLDFESIGSKTVPFQRIETAHTRALLPWRDAIVRIGIANGRDSYDPEVENTISILRWDGEALAESEPATLERVQVLRWQVQGDELWLSAQQDEGPAELLALSLLPAGPPRVSARFEHAAARRPFAVLGSGLLVGAVDGELYVLEREGGSLAEVARLQPTWARGQAEIGGLCAGDDVAVVFGKGGRNGVVFVDLSNPRAPRQFGRLAAARDEANRGVFVRPDRVVMFAPHAPVSLVELAPAADSVSRLGKALRLNAQYTEATVCGEQALFFAARQSAHDEAMVVALHGEGPRKLGSLETPEWSNGFLVLRDLLVRSTTDEISVYRA
jgi:hypothetical protein